MTFSEFARACGVIIDRPRADGRIHRCPTAAHPRSRNGAYAFDGERGWVMAWDAGGETQWYRDERATEWTEDRKREWIRRREAERREQIERNRAAAKRAEEVVSRARLGEHGYLRRKGLPKHRGLVLDEYQTMSFDEGFGRWVERIERDVLIVPMRNLSTGELQGVQAIWWDGSKWVKKMSPGMRAKGAVLRLGRADAGETWLCEGYATGLTVKAALERLGADASVLVCFSDSNLVFVSERLSGRAYVFADNDASRAGEKAAVASGKPWLMAPVVGHDANDWMAAGGLLPVCAAISALRRGDAM